MASVAGTYARAFADVILRARLDAERSVVELRSIAKLLRENVELRRVWENPSVPLDQKHRLLDAIVQRDKILRQVRNLIALLIDHRRIDFLGRIVSQLEKELDARLGIAEAEITSSRELSDAEKHEFETQVAKLTGKKVRAQYARDASLLGGAMLRVGSTIYDGSLRGQLEKMKETISS